MKGDGVERYSAAELLRLVEGARMARFLRLKFLTITLLPAGWGNTAVDFCVKIFAPTAGSSLVAHGTALSADKTLSVGETMVSVVHDGVETPCASGLVTLRNFPPVAD